MAREYVRRAEATLEEARRTFEKGDNPLTVRRSQEAVELSLKAALRFLGIEYPREHAGMVQGRNRVHGVCLKRSCS